MLLVCVNNLCGVFKKLWTATALTFTVIVARPSRLGLDVTGNIRRSTLPSALRLGLEERLSTGGKEKPTINNIKTWCT